MTEKAIQAATERYFESFNKRHFDEVMQAYADGCVLLPPDGDVIEGHAKILELQKTTAGKLDKLHLKDVFHFELLGDSTALSCLRYEARVAGDKGSLQFKAMVLWKKVGGQWKISVDMYNAC